MIGFVIIQIAKKYDDLRRDEQNEASCLATLWFTYKG